MVLSWKEELNASQEIPVAAFIDFEVHMSHPLCTRKDNTIQNFPSIRGYTN